MAWALSGGGNVGSTFDKTAGTSISLTPLTFTAPLNALLFVAVATDNVATGTGLTGSHTSVTDTQSNVYIKVAEYTFSPGGVAGDGATASLWCAHMTTALATSDTITANFSGSVTASALGTAKRTVAAGKTWQTVARELGNATATTVGPSLTFSGLASQEYNVMRVDALETFGTFTHDADYTGVTNTGTSGGLADTNIRLGLCYRIATLSTDTSADTNAGAGDWASFLVVLKEADPQFLRPVAQQSIGGWSNQAGSTTDIWNTIDETTASDADYIKSALGASTDSAVFELTSGTAPRLGDCTIRYRYRKEPSGGAQMNLLVSLYETVTLIDSNAHTDIGSTFVDGSFVVDTSTITDWTALYLAFSVEQV